MLRSAKSHVAKEKLTVVEFVEMELLAPLDVKVLQSKLTSVLLIDLPVTNPALPTRRQPPVVISVHVTKITIALGFFFLLDSFEMMSMNIL